MSQEADLSVLIRPCVLRLGLENITYCTLCRAPLDGTLAGAKCRSVWWVDHRNTSQQGSIPLLGSVQGAGGYKALQGPDTAYLTSHLLLPHCTANWKQSLRPARVCSAWWGFFGGCPFGLGFSSSGDVPKLEVAPLFPEIVQNTSVQATFCQQ